MSVDIDELRKLHAATTQGEWQWQRAYASGAHVVALGNDAIGVSNVLSRENPVHGWPAVGQAQCDANAEFIAAAHEALIPLCDRVERAEAEVVRLRAELSALRTLRPVDTSPDENTNALWWRWPVNEPPWVGCMLNDDWIEDYYTHWSPLPEVTP